jgi:hypothetical protein
VAGSTGKEWLARENMLKKMYEKEKLSHLQRFFFNELTSL